MQQINKERLFAPVLIALFAILAHAKPVKQLIPVDVFPLVHGEPSYSHPQLSPDGTMIAYMAFDDKKKACSLNLRELTEGKEKSTIIVTSGKKRSIEDLCWTSDGKQILYVQEEKLYGFNIATSKTTCYTPTYTINFHDFYTEYHIPDVVLLSFAKDNRAVPDLYKLTVSTGSLECLAENNGKIANFIPDHNLAPGAALGFDSDQVHVLHFVNKKWVSVLTLAQAQEPTKTSGCVTAFSFTEDNSSLYLVHAHNANTQRLIKLNLITKKTDILAEDPYYNVANICVTAKGKLQAVAFQKAKKEWVILDENFRDHFRAIEAIGAGEYEIVNFDKAQQKCIVLIKSDISPGKYYLYDVRSKKATFLFDKCPFLNDYMFASVKPIEFKSRDGITLHGYLTTPTETPQKQLPLVLNVHGGPYSRDTWDFNITNQFLANRGYAVLQINFRGSTGYGKEFERAGYKEWGRKMQNDLVDAVQWAIQQNIADPQKIAIMGSSYGGYAALVAATDTPDLFRCAIASGGPSSLLTFAKHSLDKGLMTKEGVSHLLGDLNNAQFLKERSPLFKVDSIKIPLLIAHGARDPIVDIAESKQLIKALREKGKKYEYVEFKDEAHGISKRKNWVTYLSKIERFLANHLPSRQNLLNS